MRKKIITLVILMTALSFIAIGLTLTQQDDLASLLEDMIAGL